ncbi:MAG: DNA adenine methylase [Treponema sp.]|jgi:DNA adenine methylase|nr:DNA adenine methylase [Treponema sp.]
MAGKNPLVKPYLKWAGGKRQLLSEIKKHVPPDIDGYTYYEPFLGAGAVFFALQPKRAVINDSNTQLMLTCTVIKEHAGELIARLKEHQDKNSAAYYYEIRNLDRNREQFSALGGVEKAARLVFLNKTCYNGLYRVNSRGFFNVPRGTYKNPSICEEAALWQISAYLNANSVTILNADFAEAVRDAGAGSFVYFDPPYHSPGRTGFTSYQADGFGEEEHRRLRDLMAALTERGAKCLQSNADTEFIRSLYGPDLFDIIPVHAKRFINSDSSGRGAAGEVLIKNRN